MSPKSDLTSHSSRISPNFSSPALLIFLFSGDFAELLTLAPSIFLICTAVTVILSAKSRNQARTNIRAGIRSSIRPFHLPSDPAPSGFPFVFRFFSGVSSVFLRISSGFLLSPLALLSRTKTLMRQKYRAHSRTHGRADTASLGFSFFFCYPQAKSRNDRRISVSARAGEKCSVGIRPTASGVCITGYGKVP